MVLSFCGRRLLSRNNFLKIPKRNGYIILVPEIGEDLPTKDPLLNENRVPAFSSVTTEKCIAAIGVQSLHFEEDLRALETKLKNNKDADIFEDVLHPLEEKCISLEMTWATAKTLYCGDQSLMPTKYYSSIHKRANNAINSKFNSLPIYEACKDALENKEKKLTDQQKRVLTRFILEGTFNTLGLGEKEKEYFMFLAKRIYNNQREFKSKVEAAMTQLTCPVHNPLVMKDFPKAFLEATAADPKEPTKGPWTITLNPSIVQLFLERCPDRALRWKVWDANVTVASLYNDKILQTSTALETIRMDKSRQAQLLGFKSFADMSMQTKMAGSLENLYFTLDTLLEMARPIQEQEIEALSKFASKKGLEGDIKMWDVRYWARKQKQELYKYNSDDLKQYFPLPKVLSGIFELIETLFNVKMVETKAADVWHKDVRHFDVFDLQKSNTVPIASFYFDPYTKKSDKIGFQQDSGWMVPIRSKSNITGSTPLAALIFNFPLPTSGTPSLLSFTNVKFLFQKFGHLLQHLLTTADYIDISGSSFIEWDAVNVPDYVFANWLYEPSVLRQISGHYTTREPLPDEMIETVRSTRSYLIGYELCEELFLSRFDLELYSSKTFWMTIQSRLWKKHFVMPEYDKDSRVCSFEKIFCDNWGAAYYSDLWSQMIAADIYSAFQEISSKDIQQQKEMAQRYRETFLSLGGRYPSGEVFRKFRGRDPNPKALFSNLGLCIK